MIRGAYSPFTLLNSYRSRTGGRRMCTTSVKNPRFMIPLLRSVKKLVVWSSGDWSSGDTIRNSYWEREERERHPLQSSIGSFEPGRNPRRQVVFLSRMKSAMASMASRASGRMAVRQEITSTSRMPRPDDELHVDTGSTSLGGKPFGVAQEHLVGPGVDQQRRQPVHVAVVRRDQGRPQIEVARIVPHIASTNSGVSTGSLIVQKDSPVPARSVAGEMHTAAAGSGSLASRNDIKVPSVRLPPAESLAITMSLGKRSILEQPAIGGQAVIQTAEYGYSGARR